MSQCRRWGDTGGARGLPEFGGLEKRNKQSINIGTP